jgi:hypothetical protein
LPTASFSNSRNLADIKKQDASLQKLEDPIKADLRYVGKAESDNLLTGIETALATLESKDPKFSLFEGNVNDLYGRLNKATFVALAVLGDISDGLKQAASQN